MNLQGNITVGVDFESGGMVRIEVVDSVVVHTHGDEELSLRVAERERGDSEEERKARGGIYRERNKKKKREKREMEDTCRIGG